MPDDFGICHTSAVAATCSGQSPMRRERPRARRQRRPGRPNAGGSRMEVGTRAIRPFSLSSGADRACSPATRRVRRFLLQFDVIPRPPSALLPSPRRRFVARVRPATTPPVAELSMARPLANPEPATSLLPPRNSSIAGLLPRHAVPALCAHETTSGFPQQITIPASAAPELDPARTRASRPAAARREPEA